MARETGGKKQEGKEFPKVYFPSSHPFLVLIPMHPSWPFPVAKVCVSHFHSASSQCFSTWPFSAAPGSSWLVSCGLDALKKTFLIFIGVELIYNGVLISAIQESESVIHIHISILFQILFLFRLLQTIEFPLPYSWSLLIIYFIYSNVYMLIPNSSFIHPSPPSFTFGNHKFVF